MSKIIPTSVLAKIISNRTFGIQKRLTSSDQINVDHAFDLARFQIQHATDYFTSHASTPVKKLKEEKNSHRDYPPNLVQTMMRNAVTKYGKNTAIVSSKEKIKWNYEEYVEVVQTAAKGFISLGLSPSKGVGIMQGISDVGIMALNPNPHWFVSSLGAIFAGGLSCGIHPASTVETIKYICQDAPLDLMVIQNIKSLEHLLQKDPSINEDIKSFILLDDDADFGGMCLDFVEYREKIFTWNEMLERGKLINDSILKEREKQQDENQACALIYKSETSGNPKGELISHDDITSRNSRFYHWTSHYLVGN